MSAYIHMSIGDCYQTAYYEIFTSNCAVNMISINIYLLMKLSSTVIAISYISRFYSRHVSFLKFSTLSKIFDV